MGKIEDMDFVLRQAQASIYSKNYPQALLNLREAKPLLVSLISDGTEFRGFITIQATAMSLFAKDILLAQEYASMLISETISEVKNLIKIYEKDKKEKNFQDAYHSILKVNSYIIAFIPYLQDHPTITLDKAASLLVDKDKASLFASIILDIRDELNSTGWKSWSYPNEVEREAKYWSAYALKELAQINLENSSSGEEIQNTQSLVEMSYDLLKGLPEDKLLADVYMLKGQIFSLNGDYSESLSNFKQSLYVMENVNDKLGTAVALGRLGEMYITCAKFAEADGDANKAAKYFQKAESFLTKSEKDLEALFKINFRNEIMDQLQTTRINLGGLYYYKKDWTKSKEVLSNVWDFYCKDSERHTPLEVQISANLGAVLIELNKLEEAEVPLLKASTSIEYIEKCGEWNIDPETRLFVFGN